MGSRRFNDEVLFTDDGIVKIGRQEVESLKEQAGRNPRKRIRLCAHKGVDDGLHEMFIIHAKDTYVRPHKHLNKSESIHVLEGSVDLIIFDEAGSITEVTRLGDYASGGRFYHRLSDPTYHTLIIVSEVIAFHETTNGPFRPADTIWAPWAPESSDDVAAIAYMEKLREEAESFVLEGAGSGQWKECPGAGCYD